MRNITIKRTAHNLFRSEIGIVFMFFLSLLAINKITIAQDKPNVLFIAIDDLNDWTGCLGGHPQAYTPNIDKLASEGLLFTNAHCQAPICGPSRASIMTGMNPSNTGNYLQIGDRDIKKSNELTRKAVFLPDCFERYGYKTMGVGKLFHQGDRADSFDEYGGRFEGSGPKPEKRMNYNPAWFPEKEGGTQTDWGSYPEHDSLMPDYKSAAWAIDKLNQKHDKPFFLGVGFVRPHVPFYVPQKWFDMFPADNIITPPYKSDDYNDIPEMGIRVSEAPMMPTTEWAIETGQWKDIVRAYLACVTFVDHQIGKVLQALKNSEYNDNTIIVLWSDHGYHLGEKNRFAKQAIWERDTRVPFIIKIPGGFPGINSNAPVQLVDIYPTLTDLCGLPKNTLNEGNSLAGFLEDPSMPWPYNALTFYGEGNISIRSERYRFIQYEDCSQELYDMINDPNEWINLAGRNEYKDIITEFQKDIPEKWATNSPYSKYNFNKYFTEKYSSGKK